MVILFGISDYEEVTGVLQGVRWQHSNIAVTSQTQSLSLILQCAFWHRPQIVIR